LFWAGKAAVMLEIMCFTCRHEWVMLYIFIILF